ncbi:hypothetical protein F4X86_00125 [Candidatus Saccharibacteria bacterium]|nr:hypothetical protein [Candidatus Saccharibacteria bacterium]
MDSYFRDRGDGEPASKRRLRSRFNLPPAQTSLSLAGGKAYHLSRDFAANWRRVEAHWSALFGKRGVLEDKLAKDQALRAGSGCGLVYTYRVDGKVRYVGRTEIAIAKHLRHGFRRGLPVYGYNIKRCLLNAAFRGALSIRTEVVPRGRLKERQAELIRLYSRCNRLWNKLHNPCFRESNFDA